MSGSGFHPFGGKVSGVLDKNVCKTSNVTHALFNIQNETGACIIDAR
jgi:hypothetical protein